MEQCGYILIDNSDDIHPIKLVTNNTDEKYIRSDELFRCKCNQDTIKPDYKIFHLSCQDKCFFGIADQSNKENHENKLASELMKTPIYSPLIIIKDIELSSYAESTSFIRFEKFTDMGMLYDIYNAIINIIVNLHKDENEEYKTEEIE